MTQYDDVEEIVLDEALDASKNLFDAVCEDCRTVARFTTLGEQKLGERFEIHCYSCNSGRFPESGETTRFQVVDLTPNPDTDPNEPSSSPVYTADESE